jgi:hypothetical protein
MNSIVAGEMKREDLEIQIMKLMEMSNKDYE